MYNCHHLCISLKCVAAPRTPSSKPESDELTKDKEPIDTKEEEPLSNNDDFVVVEIEDVPPAPTAQPEPGKIIIGF